MTMRTHTVDDVVISGVDSVVEGVHRHDLATGEDWTEITVLTWFGEVTHEGDRDGHLSYGEVYALAKALASGRMPEGIDRVRIVA
ncbi:hypothetical protein [Nocardioides sp. KR10-350]|uniref:hypothetical protein n=1 Tax=Nocardioides cheoyonin TaxID=3156615 RepID=UPI0032B5FB2E